MYPKNKCQAYFKASLNLPLKGLNIRYIAGTSIRSFSLPHLIALPLSVYLFIHRSLRQSVGIWIYLLKVCPRNAFPHIERALLIAPL